MAGDWVPRVNSTGASGDTFAGGVPLAFRNALRDRQFSGDMFLPGQMVGKVAAPAGAGPRVMAGSARGWGGAAGAGGAGGPGGGFRASFAGQAPFKIDASPGNYRPTPDALAVAGRAPMGSLRGYAQLQARRSGWEQMQDEAEVDRRILEATRQARESRVTENPALRPSWAGQTRTFQGVSGVTDVSRPATEWEEAMLPGQPAAAVRQGTAGQGVSGPVPDLVLAPNDYGSGSAVVGRREMGGPVLPGQPYVVGEGGPEVVVPAAAGTVIPTEMMDAQMARRLGVGARQLAGPGPGPGAAEDPLGPFRELTTPGQRELTRRRFMTTPQGQMWLDEQEMAQRAGAAQAAWEQEKFNATQQNMMARARMAQAGAAERQAAGTAAVDRRAEADREAKDRLSGLALEAERHRADLYLREGLLNPEEHKVFVGMGDAGILGKNLDAARAAYEERRKVEPQISELGGGMVVVRSGGGEVIPADRIMRQTGEAPRSVTVPPVPTMAGVTVPGMTVVTPDTRTLAPLGTDAGGHAWQPAAAGNQLMELRKELKALDAMTGLTDEQRATARMELEDEIRFLRPLAYPKLGTRSGGRKEDAPAGDAGSAVRGGANLGAKIKRALRKE